MNRRLLALVLLTVAVFSPSFRNGFVWDDESHLALAASSGLSHIWSSLAVSHYFPLTLTTFWVEHRLWNLDPMPYHAVNIALHAANAALLYLVLCRLRVRGAWVAAALWALHPVNVESVAWISELKNAQSGLFFLLTILCFLRFESAADRRWYIASLVCGAAAMLSKPSTVVLPAVLVWLAWWQRGSVTRTDWRRAVPFLMLTLAVSAATIVEQHVQVRIGAHDVSLTLPQRAAVAVQAVWFYLGKLLWPASLTFVYPRWKAGWVSLPVIAAFVGLITVLAGLWRMRTTPWARASFGALTYFVIALAPVLSFFDIYFFRFSFVADHFQYLASIGPLSLCAAAGATLLSAPAAQQTVATLVLATLAALSWQRCGVFRDDERLWLDTLAKNPSAAIAHNNLGNIYRRRDQFDEAVTHLREAARLNPDYPQVHNNLGAALAQSGRLAEAVDCFREALRLKPDYAEAQENLNHALALSNHGH